MFMENIRFFRCLSNLHKDTVAGSLISQNFVKGQTIVSEGDPGSSFYIIKSGEASAWRGNNMIGKLGRADCFG